MTKEEFANSIRLQVSNSIGAGIATMLEKRTSIRNRPDLLKLSDWYQLQSEEGKRQVVTLMQLAAEQATFSFFCVLDGLSAIENGPDKGKLELHFIKNGSKYLLNSEEGEYLHDIYNSHSEIE